MTVPPPLDGVAETQDLDAAGILVVDDRPGNLMAMVEILKDQGLPVVTAASGSQALRCLMQRDFAVILLDVNMPGMDGFEVARLVRARERSRHTPIIFVTAVSVGDASVTQGYSIGAVDYIFSPVVPEVLRAKVAVFVELHRKTKQLRKAASHLEMLLREKETLLQEVHHRVKNNLQVISSLLNMQMRKLDPGSNRAALEECQTRVEAIALIHQKLYQSRNYTEVPFSEYARSLAENIFHAVGASPSVALKLVIEEVVLGVDKAIPCGLILNELITNASKHAFRDGRAGTIVVELSKVDDRLVRLVVCDDGVGLPDAMDIRASDSLGLQLVCTLADQLDGTLEVDGTEGASIKLIFPVTP